MSVAAAVVYFLGFFLHYTYLITIAAFTDREDDLDMKKVMFFCVVWPLMTCWYFYNLVLVRGDDEDGA